MTLYRMLQRRGTALQWSTANTVLGVGEVGFAFDTNVVKIGDGLTAWNSLASLDGKSAYELAVANGYSGTQSQWLASLVGATGPAGPQGPAGITNAHQSVVTLSEDSGAGVSTYFAGTVGADGGFGVGAYIEANANGAITAISGVTPTITQRVLFTGRANSSENGIYTLTNAGSSTTKWRFTRATDYDNANPQDVNVGDFVFVVSGTFADKVYIMNSSGTGPDGSIIIGTDNITWTQTGGVGPQGPAGPTGPAGTYTVNSPLSLTGSTLSVQADPTFTGTVTATTFSGTATNSSKYNNRALFVQTATPTIGMVNGDIWIKI